MRLIGTVLILGLLAACAPADSPRPPVSEAEAGAPAVPVGDAPPDYSVEVLRGGSGHIAPSVDAEQVIATESGERFMAVAVRRGWVQVDAGLGLPVWIESATLVSHPPAGLPEHGAPCVRWATPAPPSTGLADLVIYSVEDRSTVIGRVRRDRRFRVRAEDRTSLTVELPSGRLGLITRTQVESVSVPMVDGEPCL